MDAFDIDEIDIQDIGIPGSGYESARSEPSVGTDALPTKLVEEYPSYLVDVHRQIQHIRRLVQFGRLIEAWIDMPGLLRKARLHGRMFLSLMVLVRANTVFEYI